MPSLQGLVINKQLDRYEVLIEGLPVPCLLSGSLRHSASRGLARNKQSAEAVAVGDRVLVQPASGLFGSGSDRSARNRSEPAPGDPIAGEPLTGGRICEVLPRTNRLARRAAGPKPVEQVLAANVDLAVLVFAAAEPKPRWTMLDRFLVQAEAAEIAPLICITKMDLVEPRVIEEDLARYREIGYPVVFTSVQEPGASGEDRGNSVAELEERLRGKVSVLVGKSGVGKSTLVNVLLEKQLATRSVSRSTGKGRHTTSEARMYLLPQGGGIIDTPGLREFGLWRIPASEVAQQFPEMREHLDGCRFRSGCTHSHEPGCAIKEAVRSGKIHPERYRSYLRITGSAADDDMEEEPAGPSPSGGSPGGSSGGHRSPRSVRSSEGSGYKHSANNERRGPETPESFPCAHCGMVIPAEALGTEHRNHCPYCLWSRHVDHRPGDRAAGCGGSMEPLAVAVRTDGEWTLLHRCRECGVIKANRIAGDDNGALLLSMAARPMARPPFPLDRMHSVGT